MNKVHKKIVSKLNAIYLCLYIYILIYCVAHFRPEATTPIPQQAVHGRGGLTAYDTVAV